MKISIITINYNNAAGLEKTLHSVMRQTYSLIEYLIVDGGSSDASTAIIEKHKDFISKSVSEKDNGIYHAMNKGITMATGDYLLFLNSGDVLTSESVIADIVRHSGFKADIVYGDYQFEEGAKIYPDVVTPYYFMKSSLPHQSTFFHKTVFEKMGGFDETYRISADRAFYLKCCVSNQFSWQHIHYFVTLFDLEGLSNNPSYFQKKQEEDERLWEHYYGVFYQDYKAMFALEQENKRLKQLSVKGVLVRVKNKIKKLCRIL